MSKIISTRHFETFGFLIPREYDNDSFCAGIDYILQKIDEEPALEIHGNVRGAWEYSPDGYPFCSVCGDSPWDNGAEKGNFCSNCGADMRENVTMTNREYLATLSNYELAEYIYSFIVPVIGKSYTSSINGVAEWLGERRD